MRSKTSLAGLCLAAASLFTAPGARCIAGDASASPGPADTVYRNGFIYTVDAKDSVQQALAIRAGRIVYVGGDAGLAPFVGEHTTAIDLRGRMLMPGLVDGHMHPLMGGAALLKCNLNYEQLRVEADAGEDPGMPGPNADERTGCVARSRELVSRGNAPRRLRHHASHAWMR